MRLHSRHANLRLFAHTRRIVLSILPLGAAVGLVMTAVMLGLEHGAERLNEELGHSWLHLLLPLMALFLCTLWLTGTRTGEVSLFEDLDLAKHSPYEAFPFRKSLAKVVGCGFTIGLGGSTGLEGPAKWLGASLGVQFHRLISFLSRRFRPVRHFKGQPLTMVTAGAASAVAVVFRAPLSGALFAAEHDGHLSSEELIPSVVAAAAAYVVYAGWVGTQPLLPFERAYSVARSELFYALILGLACGLAASAFLTIRDRLTRWLKAVKLPWRGLVGGLGLALLAAPGHWFFHDLQITQRGGLELVLDVLRGAHPTSVVLMFAALKVLATALTLAAGGVGGMWLCTVAMGACLGAAFDHWWLPGYPGLMAMLGGAAFAGASHRTILVPVVFLAETTAQAGLVVPALVACTMAVLVVQVHTSARKRHAEPLPAPEPIPM